MKQTAIALQLILPFFFKLRDTVEVSNEDSDQNKSFDIAIKCVNANLNMNELIRYTKNGITGEIPQSVIQAVDIALRCGLSSTL